MSNYTDQKGKIIRLPTFNDPVCPGGNAAQQYNIQRKTILASAKASYQSIIGPRRTFDPQKPIIKGAPLRLGISDINPCGQSSLVRVEAAIVFRGPLTVSAVGPSNNRSSVSQNYLILSSQFHCWVDTITGMVLPDDQYKPSPWAQLLELEASLTSGVYGQQPFTRATDFNGWGAPVTQTYSFSSNFVGGSIFVFTGNRVPSAYQVSLTFTASMTETKQGAAGSASSSSFSASGTVNAGGASGACSYSGQAVFATVASFDPVVASGGSGYSFNWS